MIIMKAEEEELLTDVMLLSLSLSFSRFSFVESESMSFKTIINRFSFFSPLSLLETKQHINENRHTTLEQLHQRKRDDDDDDVLF